MLGEGMSIKHLLRLYTNRKYDYGLEIPYIYCLYRSPERNISLAHEVSGHLSLHIGIGLGCGLPWGAVLTVAGGRAMVIDALHGRWLEQRGAAYRGLIHGKYMKNFPFHARRLL